MGDPLEGPKHRSGVASLMRNEGQDWDSCSESPQTSQYPHPASWFAFAPFIHHLPLFPCSHGRKQPSCGPQFSFFSVQETSRYSLVSLRGKCPDKQIQLFHLWCLQTSIPCISSWPKLIHMATPRCKGGGVMWSLTGWS